MKFDNLIFEVKNKIAIITFNRPQALNAMNRETVLELGQAIEECKKNPDIKVVVLTGAGGKSFVAGADISRMISMTAMEGRDFMALGQEVLAQIENMSKPVIAAVNGFALGGGLEIAMACDIRFASEDAVVGQPETLIGIMPGWGGSQRLSRYIGKGIAKELVLSGESISAQRGYELGLINRIFPKHKLMEETLKFAEKLTKLPAVALKLAKQSIDAGYDMDLVNSNKFEVNACGLCFSTDDQKIGMKAFLEKKKPEFTGK